MSYLPTQWKAGDTVTSAKLNKIEQGITGCKNILIINVIDENYVETLDKTWQEIFDADLAFIVESDELFKSSEFVTSCFYSNGEYNVRAGSHFFTASNANDYPTGDSPK